MNLLCGFTVIFSTVQLFSTIQQQASILTRIWMHTVQWPNEDFIHMWAHSVSGIRSPLCDNIINKTRIANYLRMKSKQFRFGSRFVHLFQCVCRLMRFMIASEGSFTKMRDRSAIRHTQFCEAAKPFSHKLDSYSFMEVLNNALFGIYKTYVYITVFSL